MSDDLIIRPIDITKQLEVAKLYKAIRMAEDASHVPHVRKERIRRKLKEDVDRAFMFQRGARLLGAARISSDPNYRYIKDFAIFPAHQGKGYGTAAFNKLLEELPGEGPIELDVGGDNERAQKLYENAGFKKVHQWTSTGNWHMKKDAAMTPEERKLRQLAKPYYVAHGNNSWDHIQQVYNNANAMTQQIYGRPLTLSEKAAILFHDSAVKPMGRKQHGQNARDIAIPILLSTGYFDQRQLDDIGQAILEHDTLDNKGGPFTSTTGEVLASADTEPPDIPWILNKIYGWHVKNTPNKADWKQGMYDSVHEYFVPSVKSLQPPLYNKFHKNRRQEMKERFANMTADEMWDIVTKYRKKHRIGENEVRYPASTVMKAAKLDYTAILNNR